MAYLNWSSFDDFKANGKFCFTKKIASTVLRNTQTGQYIYVGTMRYPGFARSLAVVHNLKGTYSLYICLVGETGASCIQVQVVAESFYENIVHMWIYHR